MGVELRRVHGPLLTLGIWLLAGVAFASPAEQKRACVAASTQGQTERDAGDLLEAKKQLLLCASDECPPVVRKSCGEWLADVEERIPSVVVRVLDPKGADVTDAQLSIDGAPAQLDGRPVLLNPGPHTLLVTDASGKQTERKVLLAEKESSRLVSIQITDENAEYVARNESSGEISTHSTGKPAAFKVPVGAWVLGGVGIAGLAAFTYFAVSANNELNDLEDPETGCSPNCTSAQTEDGKRSALIADISLGVGAAALIGAGTWTLLAWRKSKQSPSDRQVSLLPTRDGVFAGFRTRF